MAQTIVEKLARVRKAAPAEWTEKDCRHLIHGTGGSPRRARRLLRSDVKTATLLRDAYAHAIEAGVPHTTAVVNCGRIYQTAINPGELLDPEDAGRPGSEDEGDEPEDGGDDVPAELVAAVGTAAPELADLFAR